MAFFKKLKERLFKSSSKIDEGLDAIVSDGGEAEVETRTEPEAEPEIVPETDRFDEVIGMPTAEGAAEAVAELAGDKDPAEGPEDASPEIVPETDRFDEVIGMPDAEGAADAVAELEGNEDTAALSPDPQPGGVPDQARDDGDFDAPATDPGSRELDVPDQVRDDEEPEPPVLPIASAEGVPVEAYAPEAEDREAVVAPMTTLAPSALDEPDAPEPEKKGLLGRLFGREQKTVVRRTLDDDMLEQLEELLITTDMGVDTALRVTANMAEGNMGRRLSVDEIKGLMATEIARIMEPVARPMPLYAQKPQVVLVVGVNGSGKTTTIGKLASQFRAAGKSVVIAAGDTFRAAAVEQLQVWGERAGVPVLTAPEGSDPASLAFDAMTKAQADGADLLMIDTAGRLQNRADLMEELAKIVRVIRKKDPDAPHNTLLVLDATTGQNALNQVREFQKLSDVSGLVMTKLDGTAKGGVLVALADKFGLPIHAIGVGEQIDDLDAFDPQDFADALVGRGG